MKLLVACHDAGGAEIVSSWLARRRGEDAVTCVLAGPAEGIFARKLGRRGVAELPPLAGFDLVLCGSSGEAGLERRAVRAARDAGVRSAVWLDHWVAYARRFDDGAGLVLPDAVWVADEHAARLAAEALPGADVRLAGNPYLEDAVAAIRGLEAERGPGGRHLEWPPAAGGPALGERILYVCEPTSAAAERETGDPRGWGYDEREALAGFLATLDGTPAVRVRPHPAEPAGKYEALLGGAELSAGRSLAQDIAWADMVVGCDTMAMVVALQAGRRVVSAIPPGGRPLSLPFPAIERLHQVPAAA